MEVIEGALASNEKYETILFPIGEKCGLDKKNAAQERNGDRYRITTQFRMWEPKTLQE